MQALIKPPLALCFQCQKLVTYPSPETTWEGTIQGFKFGELWFVGDGQSKSTTSMYKPASFHFAKYTLGM